MQAESFREFIIQKVSFEGRYKGKGRYKGIKPKKILVFTRFNYKDG